VVTAPLNASMKRQTGRRSTVLVEPGEAPHWLRWLPDGRALFAGGLSRPSGLRKRDQAVRRWTAELMYELSVRYPEISGLPAEYGWSAPVVSTLDGLPWVGPHRNYPFHFFAMALGWHGDSLSWFAAKAALRYFRGDAAKADDALGFGR
jgi:glycine/D-amino acid oxidase-like deaminating enzyme